MLTEDRWNRIIEMVETEGTVTVSELAAKLRASESTIRRDLVQLDRQGRLRRVHGGAALPDARFVMTDEAVSDRDSLLRPEKEAIAAHALPMIGPDDFVYIDAGSTTARLVDLITPNGASFVTNSVEHAIRLLRKGCPVILPGGELKYKTEALVGAQTVEHLRRFHFTIGFFGTNGVSEETGFTTPEINEAIVKETALAHTAKPLVLCDHSKFQKVSPVSFARFEAAQIVTDRLIDERYRHFQHITEVMRG